MRPSPLAALGLALGLLTAPVAQAYSVPYTPFPPGGFVDTRFGWEFGGGPVHGIGSITGGPFQPYTPGDTEWIVEIPDGGGFFEFVQIYSPVIDSLFALSLNGMVLPWDSEATLDLGTYAEIYALSVPAGLNVFTVEIIRDGNEQAFRGPISPDELRFGQLRFNTDPGVAPAIPLPPAVLPLLGGLAMLAGLCALGRRRRG